MIVFYSRYGNTARMAEEIAFGAKGLESVTVTLRIPPLYYHYNFSKLVKGYLIGFGK
jgi:flavodoxin